GRLIPKLKLPFYTSDGKPLWHQGLDTSNFTVTSTTLIGQTDGNDPIVWTSLSKPLPLNLYSYLEIEAKITPPAEPVETSLQVFFKSPAVTTDVESYAISSPFPADGKRHKIKIKLEDYPFVLSTNILTGLRIDPGNINESTFEIYSLVFL